MPLWDDFIALCISLFVPVQAFIKSAFTSSGLPVKQLVTILVIVAITLGLAKALLFLLKNTIEILQRLVEISIMLLKLLSVIVGTVFVIALFKTLFVPPNSTCGLIRELPFVRCVPISEPTPAPVTPDKLPQSLSKPVKPENNKPPSK
ncbi:hypothetical protein [Beggiatoa leptomitoformis]|uniref:Uncharacterized protein n=1 Tax=Beggiatoa leptomitoformis TaxID=288004 RepID=A0A2N9YEX6_9GAMM|nr:hypothetical protein [Beggiatoa leptomitoformis]ALG68624.1 hypothetical protein AL038_14070 [Beggiatoa leptomitoformis]AUI69030.1 hypothetical protein BLE401_10185 [Beggiatoa leptomitoformis]